MVVRTIKEDLDFYPVCLKNEMKNTFFYLVSWQSMLYNIKAVNALIDSIAEQSEYEKDENGEAILNENGEKKYIIPESMQEAWNGLWTELVEYEGRIDWLKSKLPESYHLDNANNVLTFQESNWIEFFGVVNAVTAGKQEASYPPCYVYRKTVNTKGQQVKERIDRFTGFTSLSNAVENYCSELAEGTKESKKQALWRANKNLLSFLAHNFTFDNENGEQWNVKPSAIFDSYKITVNLKKADIMNKLILGCSFRAKTSTDGKSTYVFNKSLFWKNLSTWIYTQMITDGVLDFGKNYSRFTEESCIMPVADGVDLEQEAFYNWSNASK